MSGDGGSSGDEWKKELICNKDSGAPRALLANAIKAFRDSPDWHARLWFDAFRQMTVLRGCPPWTRNAGPDREWTDMDDVLAAEWLQHNGIHVSSDIAGQAVEVVSRERRFHPVLEYLSRCEWDGIERLDQWPVRYLGAKDTLYTRGVGSRWMISAVARVSEPGCKADCCLVLEGEQGLKKSTAVRTLAQPWFADEIDVLGSKDSALQLAGVWVMEMPEMERMTRATAAQLKAWMSRSVDRFRPPYAKRVVEQPRQCVFAGTVNLNDYLRDETGARRFWPVSCKVIDIDELAVDRDQLWAEARHRYLQGDAWWLETRALQKSAEEQQGRRYQGDPWESRIADAIKRTTAPYVMVSDLLSTALAMPVERWTQADQNRVAKCLRSFGWERRQARTKDGLRQWRYYPPGSPDEPEEPEEPVSPVEPVSPDEEA